MLQLLEVDLNNGLNLMKQGKCAQATAKLKRVWDQSVRKGSHRLRIDSMAAYARSIIGHGRGEEAHAILGCAYEESKTFFAETEPIEHAHTLLNIAEAYNNVSLTHRVRPLVERSIAIILKNEPATIVQRHPTAPPWIVDALILIYNCQIESGDYEKAGGFAHWAATFCDVAFGEFDASVFFFQSLTLLTNCTAGKFDKGTELFTDLELRANDFATYLTSDKANIDRRVIPLEFFADLIRSDIDWKELGKALRELDLFESTCGGLLMKMPEAAMVGPASGTFRHHLSLVGQTSSTPQSHVRAAIPATSLSLSNR